MSANRPISAESWQKIVKNHDPNGRLIDVQELVGGQSAAMHLLVYTTSAPHNTPSRIIVRQPRPERIARQPDIAEIEYQLLQTLHPTPIKTAQAYQVDTTQDILPTPYLVIEHMPGQPNYDHAQHIQIAEQAATQLAHIHQTDLSGLDTTCFPLSHKNILVHLDQRQSTSLEKSIVDCLTKERDWITADQTETLLHGDYWCGNWLWHNGEISAIIDWEDAQLGSYYLDLAISRLDMQLIFGSDACARFTETYRRRTKSSLEFMPQWDLYAALRALPVYRSWAEGWEQLGRPDLTAETMTQALQSFMANAWQALD